MKEDAFSAEFPLYPKKISKSLRMPGFARRAVIPSANMRGLCVPHAVIRFRSGDSFAQGVLSKSPCGKDVSVTAYTGELFVL